MTKFGFICSGKGEIFWMKTQRNETISLFSKRTRTSIQNGACSKNANKNWSRMPLCCVEK